MYHPLYSLSLLLLLLIFFFPESNGNSFTANCPSHMCGDVTVQYPFWRKDNLTSHQYCGYPGFGLDCSAAGDPIFYVAGDAFYVREIYYDNYTLNLVDRHAANLTCPRPRHNLTLETLPLGYSVLDANLSFYFNCTSYPPLVPPIECLQSCANESYAFLVGREPEGFDWVEYCEEKVVATVMEREVDINGLITGFGGAMNEGFVMDWRTMVDCRRCEDSDGRCGFNNVHPNFLCFCSDDTIKSDRCNDDGLNLGLKLGIGVGAASIVLLSFSICAIIYCIRKYSKTTSLPFWKRETENSKKVEAFIKQYGSSTPRRYKYSDIKKITNSFKHELGQGGYGSVYKGGLADGRLVAVKVLNTSKGNGEDFINEVASMGRTSHVNVVTLLGFCYEHKKRALIYEFMSNGSLEKFIYRKIPPTTDQHLGGEKLYEIAFGIARGLEYLHRGCNTRILHFDIKPHNILLDEDFCPKISDFGLAKLYPKKESIVSMLEARGTIGYIAPEVFSRNFGGVSHKSDVYSYGMMVLEMVGGRKNIDAGVCHTSEIYFPHWIYNQLELDQDLQLQGLITIEENKIAKKMILVGLWCIQADPSQRPSMNKVIGMLEGRMEALKIPPKPFLYSPQSPHHSSTTTTTLPI